MNYTADIMKYDLLDANQEQELATKVANGDLDAMNALVCANLRLVTKIAQEYKGKGVDLDDLIQAGKVGLINAARKYKPNTGARFQTFAQFYIKHGMKDILSKMSCAVSMSIGSYGRHRIARDAMEKLGENCTEEEIAKKCGRKKKTDMSAILRGGGVKVSLNERIGDDEKRTYLDAIEEEESDSVTESIMRNEQIAVMLDCLESLDEDERYVIEGLFGMNGEKKVLREIGDELGKTAERIRQIKENALGKLRDAIVEKLG